MCGIVGYIGKREALPILLDGLHRLEYRGYDSAGIGIVKAGRLNVVKTQGRVADLEKKITLHNLSGTLSIGHTRWATHGEPSEMNAHPHTDCTARIAVVHNGIIENCHNLKEWLERAGHTFKSATDTEILAHLIELYYENDLPTAVGRALAHVQGTYGIAVVSSEEQNVLVAARFGSPLVVGVKEDEYLIASDPSALIAHTREVVYLRDGDLAVLTRNGFEVKTLENTTVKRDTLHLDWTLDSIERGGFDHFMEKEINEEPTALENALRGRLNLLDGLAVVGGFRDIERRLKHIRKIHVIGCGTAHYAAMVGARMIEEYARIPAEADVASEFRYRNPAMSPQHTLVIAISQSGETADTIGALAESKRRGVATFGIVNVVGSTIAREVDAGMYTHAGPEIGVASTKAFVNQLACLALFTIGFGRMHGLSVHTAQLMLEELRALPDHLRAILSISDKIKTLAEKYHDAKGMLFLGRRYLYPIALEGALKLKEVSYLHAEGNPTGEMKHGPIALITHTFPTVVLAPKNTLFAKHMANIAELKARGGPVIAITTPDGVRELSTLADDIIVVPKVIDPFMPIVAVLPLHLFAYHVAVLRGYDPDRPRNLAKSVTVE